MSVPRDKYRGDKPRSLEPGMGGKVWEEGCKVVGQGILDIGVKAKAVTTPEAEGWHKNGAAWLGRKHQSGRTGPPLPRLHSHPAN